MNIVGELWEEFLLSVLKPISDIQTDDSSVLRNNSNLCLKKPKIYLANVIHSRPDLGPQIGHSIMH
jgi:hypothetical protein